MLILKQFSGDLEENLINILAKLSSGSKTFSDLSFFILGKEFLTKKKIGKLKGQYLRLSFFIFVPSFKNAH